MSLNFFPQRNSGSTLPKFESFASFPSSPLCSGEELPRDCYSRLRPECCLPLLPSATLNNERSPHVV